MLRFKQFAGSGDALEQSVNEWLERTEPDIRQMVQTVDASGAVTIGFLFEESFRSQELRYAEESGMSDALDPAIPSGSIPDRPVQVPMEP